MSVLNSLPECYLVSTYQYDRMALDVINSIFTHCICKGISSFEILECVMDLKTNGICHQRAAVDV